MKPASCGKEKLIDLYLDDELDADARQEVESHLRGCARCREILADRRRQAEAYRAVIAAAVETAAGNDATWSAVKEGLCRPARIIRLRFAAWASAAAAAAAAAFLLLHPSPGTPPPAFSSKILSLNSPGHDITIYQPQTGFTVVWLQEQS